MKKFFTKEYLKELFYVTIGNLLVAISFSFFLDPNNLVMGGATGAATILKVVLGFDTAISVFIINVVLLLIGLLFLGKDLFIKTLYSTIILPAFISICNFIYGLLVEEGEVLISEPMLVIIFSSLILGIGIGIVMKHGGTTGGTEIPQKLLFKYAHIPYSLSLYIIDGIIILLGAIFITDGSSSFDIHMILYAIIFLYLSGMVIDQIVFSGFNSRAVHIISEKNEELKEKILQDFERGVTQIKILGGYTNEEKSQLVCILPSNEYYRLKSTIHEIDPNAFFYVVRANEVSGEGFSKHHG